MYWMIYLHLCIGPTGNFYHHVADRVVARYRVQWDVVEWRDASIILILCTHTHTHTTLYTTHHGLATPINQVYKHQTLVHSLKNTL